MQQTMAKLYAKASLFHQMTICEWWKQTAERTGNKNRHIAGGIGKKVQSEIKKRNEQAT